MTGGETMPETPTDRPTERAVDTEEALLEDLDWQDLVRRHPWPALALAALGGFILARRRGPEVVESLSGYAAETVVSNVNQILGDEIL